MQKHAACAAARSSSGLVVPAERSVRDAHVTSTSGNAPLSGEVVPDPWARSPSQTVVALLTAAIGSSWVVLAHLPGARFPTPFVPPRDHGSREGRPVRLVSPSEGDPQHARERVLDVRALEDRARALPEVPAAA